MAGLLDRVMGKASDLFGGKKKEEDEGNVFRPMGEKPEKIPTAGYSWMGGPKTQEEPVAQPDTTLQDNVFEYDDDSTDDDDPTDGDDTDKLWKKFQEATQKDVVSPEKISLSRQFSDDMQAASEKARAFIDNFEKEESKLEVQELVETMAHAVTQLGAALSAGDKYDASGLKFDKKDWEKKADRLQSKFNQALDVIRNKESMERRADEEQARIDLTQQQSTRAERQARLAALGQAAGMEQQQKRHAEELASRERIAKDKLGNSFKTDKQKQAFLKEARVIARGAGSKDEKGSQLRQIMIQNGIPKKDAEEATKNNWWFNPNPAEMMDNITKMVFGGGDATPSTPSTSTGSQEAIQVQPDGRKAVFNTRTKQFVRWAD